ncbi:E3 ubiquitin-protein ligase TRAIP-like isoform X1 [Euwallacea similis]|uniref:E3 ubiquitin-protein ligase TRAIP-like isoform X1 n=1 Tax=Euwallacea similis TaxID=1736056 RepID=UPI00344B5799
MHITCVICSDLFTPSADIYSTQCGHIFHYTCLLHWFENSKTCPQCRNKVSTKSLVRLYVNVAQSQDLGDDVTVLQHKLDSIEFSMKLKEQEMKNIAIKNKEIENKNKALLLHVKELETSERTYDSIVAALKEQVKFFKGQVKNCNKLKDEVTKLKNEIKGLENVQIAVSGTKQQVQDIIRNENNVESLALLAATLKKSLVDTDRRKRELQHEHKKTQNELLQCKRKMDDMKCKLDETKRQLISLKSSYEMEVNFLKNKFTQLTVRLEENRSSDCVNNSIQRIVAESPVNYNRTPVVLSRHNGNVINFSESFTPPRVDRTRDRSPHTPPLDPACSQSVDDSIDTIVVEESPLAPSSMGIFGLQRTTKKTATGNKFSIFKQPSTSSAASNGNKRVTYSAKYDGLGGSSKEDVFPTPSGIKRPKHAKSSSSKLKKLSAEAGKQHRTISDFVNLS